MRSCFFDTMAIAYCGNITYQKGHERSIVPVYYALSLEELESYALKLVGLTNCATIRVSYITIDTLTGYDETPGTAVEDIAQKARIQVKQTPPEEGVYPYREVDLPAPKMEIFDFLAGQGYRVKKTIGDQVAAAFSELTGKTFVFTHGWLSGGD